MEIDYTEYAVLLFEKDVPEGLKRYRSVKIEGNTLIFVPHDKSDAEIYKHKRMKFKWSFMHPVLRKIIDEDWEIKFENDSDWDQLQEIEENLYTQLDRLLKIAEYFKYTYKDGDTNPDPILLSRLIITPRDSDYSFIFYYGETMNLENNSDEHIKHLFDIIIQQMDNI